MSHVTYNSHAGYDVLSVEGIVSVFKNVTAWFVKRAQLRATERHLYSLDDRQLNDIGLCRADIHDVVWGRPNNA